MINIHKILNTSKHVEVISHNIHGIRHFKAGKVKGFDGIFTTNTNLLTQRRENNKYFIK